MLKRILLGNSTLKLHAEVCLSADSPFAISAACRHLSQSQQPVEPSISNLEAASHAADASRAGFSAVPSTAKVLGLAGILPFVVLSPPVANVLPLVPADLAAVAPLLQLGYGASIASFLGGIHWSLAMVNYPGTPAAIEAARDRYIWSVTPCLLAWPAVAMPIEGGSFVLASTLSIAYLMDRGFAARGLLPAWYMSLRWPLTLGAVAGLLTSLAGSVLQQPPVQREVTLSA